MSKKQEITVSQCIVQFLKRKNIECVFELSGGMIMDLIDTLHVDGQIRIVNVHHEQSAAFAADAVGRLSGAPGVAIATSGPGATNLLTGIGSCYFDSSPALFITGQVKSNEQKGSRNIRQLGFQETDIVSMAKPVSKAVYRIRSADEVPGVLEEAFRLTLTGRPGPVLIDIPMELFRSTIRTTGDGADGPALPVAPRPPIAAALARTLIADLKASRRPLILIGGGVRAADAANLLLQFSALTKTPVVWSLMASDVVPFDSPNAVGMIGTYGNRWANLAVSQSDFILVLGSRLDIRQTGANTVSFKRGRIIYHVDVEEGEINNRVVDCQPVVADIGECLSALLEIIGEGEFDPRVEWIQNISALRAQWPDTSELLHIRGINPNHFMKELSAGQQAAVYAVDVGQHQMWAAQSLRIGAGQRFITSGGMGAMGFALPAAIGAAFQVGKGRPIVAIAGDAGFQLNIQELQTIVRNRLPVKIVVINNNCHGMTRQFQETYFQSRYQGTVWDYDAPDFEKVANAYGINGATVSVTEEIPQALAAFWHDPLEPFMLQVIVDTYTNVYPKLAFGKEISDMEPFAKPIEMEGT
jgi:acetolactate synthase-1/2/3 large subunit